MKVTSCSITLLAIVAFARAAQAADAQGAVPLAPNATGDGRVAARVCDAAGQGVAGATDGCRMRH